MKLKILMIAALVAAFVLPAAVFAVEEEPTTEEQPAEVEEVEENEQPEVEENENFNLTIKVLNLAGEDRVVERLSLTYELKSALGVTETIKLHEEKIIKDGEYKIAEDALGRKWIEIDESEVRIFVYPALQDIQIIHHLFDCNGKVVARFIENATIDFLAELNDETAAEIAKTRINKINAKGFIFKEAKAEEIVKLPAGVTVKTLDGEDVTPDEKLPAIHLYYVNAECLTENNEPTETENNESKVDDAHFNYTQDPTATLPATGAQDLLAFFMSAVALLGIGIFFAKKH